MGAQDHPTRPRFTRTRSAAVVASGTIAVLFGVLWVVAQFRVFGVEYRSGSIENLEVGPWPFEETVYNVGTEPTGIGLWFLHVNGKLQHPVDRVRFHEDLGLSLFHQRAWGFNLTRVWYAEFITHEWRMLGLGASRIRSAGRNGLMVEIPYWLLIIIFATPPLLASARNRRRRIREKKGQCLKCGYQLDADMTTCPECGDHLITITTRDDSSGNSMQMR